MARITIQAQVDIEAYTQEEARAKALELASWDNARDDRANGIEWESDPASAGWTPPTRRSTGWWNWTDQREPGRVFRPNRTKGDQTMNLTNTQQTILEAAATRPDGAIYPMPDRIKGGAALKVIKALADKGLIQDAGDNDWRIADEGFKAIGQEPPIQNDDFEADVAAAEEALQIEPPADGEPSTEPDPLTALFEQIALDHLFIDTLETRRSDRLDFHDVSVWGVKSALEAAYQAGMEAGNKATRKR